MAATVTAPAEAPTAAAAPTADPRVPWRPSLAGTAARLAVFAVIGAVLLATPHLLPEALVNVYSRAMVFGIVALSMNVLLGYAGDVSLGHNAFVGVGAFTAAFLLERSGLPWLAAVLGAVVLGALISLGLGAVALRVRGLYFALVTIAYGLFVERTVFNIQTLTGGGAGAVAPRPAFAETDVLFAYVCLGFLILTWVFDWRVTGSKAGRAIQALRDDPRVAASWGIDVRGYKLLAFMLSGGIAGLGGALFASTYEVISPITFGFALALTFVLMTVVGGVRSRPGVVIGGFVFAALPTLLDSAHKAWGEGEAICTTAPPRFVQFVVGFVVFGAIAERAVHAFKHGSLAGKASWSVAGLGGLAGGLGWLGLGGFFGWYCLWGTIDALWEPLIGVALLLFTLIQFPGGIAEQFAPVFRWLSFRPFREARARGAAGIAPDTGE